MRPSVPALAVVALLAAVPTATAKEIQGGRVCGADGCRATGRLGIDAVALTPPGEDVPMLQPWYRIRMRMGDGGHVMQTFRVLWAPRERIVAYDEKNPRWFAAPPAAVRIARRITRGVEPFPAATMPLHLPPVRAGEVIGPVRTNDAEAGGGGAPWGPGGAAAAGMLVAGLGLRRYRSRRAKPRTASTPTTPT